MTLLDDGRDGYKNNMGLVASMSIQVPVPGIVMSRLHTALPGLAAVFAIATASQGRGEQPEKPLYFPAEVGARWVYESGNRETVEVITAVEDKGGAKIVSVGWERDGKVIPAFKVMVSEAGLFRDQAEQGGKPYCLLKLPHKPGEKWQSVLAGGNGVKIKVASTAEEPEQVKVPAGTYTAVRFREEYTIQGKSYKTTFWYAPKVGLVKMEADQIDKVLKSFTAGKKN